MRLLHFNKQLLANQDTEMQVFTKVFVYGTLKPGEKYHEAYCGGAVVKAEAAIAPGRLYHLPQGYPAMALGNDPIQGVVLSLNSSSALHRLDSLEDYNPKASPEQNLYQRERCLVTRPNGSELGEVWLYRMALEKIQALGGIYLPEGLWSRSVISPNRPIRKQECTSDSL